MRFFLILAPISFFPHLLSLLSTVSHVTSKNLNKFKKKIEKMSSKDLQKFLKFFFDALKSEKEIEPKLIEKILFHMETQEDISVFVDSLFDNPVNDYEKILNIILKLNSNLVPIFKKVFGEKFIKSKKHPRIVTQLIPELYNKDMCGDGVIEYVSKNQNKSIRMIFLNKIKEKIKSLILARENLEVAQKQKTISKGIIEIHEMIARECNG